MTAVPAAPSAPAATAESGTRPSWRPRVSATVLALAVLWGTYALAGALLAGRWWVWNGLGLAPPIAHVAVPVLLAAVELAAGARRRRVFAATALALAAGLTQTGLVPYQPAPEPAATAGRDVVVVGWNTFSWEQENDPRGFYDYLRSLDADVYMLQEHQHAAAPDDRPAPLDDLDRVRRELPGYTAVAEGEFLTLSRYPVTASSALAPDDLPPPRTDWPEYWDVRALRTDVRVGDRTLSLYNTHAPDLFNVNRSPFQADFYEELADSASRRTSHLGELRDDLRRNPHPVVLTGDLNVQPGSADLRWYDGLRDAARGGADRYPATFPAGLALWRLDWMFTSDDVGVLDHDVLPDAAAFSTHRPIRATVRLP
ncbi:endonuclease/exonuclease/phosphatase family protein [Myceligenerans crystallogenes]|uniref:Endonuclease/exonuclease/phosphatase family protein n=1 Tax=Myceligenerans crystallogenes TaxID=316335 RepID=A0ABN2N958_9MICO